MERLTNKEEEVMHILWNIQKGFVKDIIARMPDPKPPYNTISSLVRVLESKGFAGYKAYGKTHEYFPLISKEDYRRNFMNKVVRDYFSNSYKNALSFFAQEEKIGIKELKEIIRMIEKGKPDEQ